MRKNREDIVELEQTRFYHCISRCVRRSFLCGKDVYTGKDFSHRRSWMVERIKELGDMFAVRICAYAIMENHYHLVLYVDLEEAQKWSDDEVIGRWKHLFKYANPNEEGAIEKWRQRLCDISWFMRSLNEPLARLANKEDKCKGHFWEGRYKCQALLDRTAVLACMAYVDLNPIRAGIQKTPEESEFTSIQERIEDWKGKHRENKAGKKHKKKQKTRIKFRQIKVDHKTRLKVSAKPLMNFPKQSEVDKLTRETVRFSLPVTEEYYLKLLDWSGRAVQKNKRGAIPIELAPIMERLELADENWLEMIHSIETAFSDVAGTSKTLREFTKNKNKKWVKGIKFLAS
jgi:REP element-mobilizing transposase RayT